MIGRRGRPPFPDIGERGMCAWRVVLLLGRWGERQEGTEGRGAEDGRPPSSDLSTESHSAQGRRGGPPHTSTACKHTAAAVLNSPSWYYASSMRFWAAPTPTPRLGPQPPPSLPFIFQYG